MLSTKFLFFPVLILVSAFILQGEIFAQEEIAVDTSDYLPYYYSGALEINLMIAASKGNDSEVERLLRKGADIDEESAEGATPLVFAVANNHMSTVKILLFHLPDINKRTSTSETPLIISVKNQNAEIAETLIRAGAEVDQTDKNGVAPLHFSSINGSFELTDLLLYYEADVNKKANDGTTPIMAAIWAGFPDVADLLIQTGANLEARDNDGFTPLLIAAQNGDTLIISRLLKEGVNIYEKNIFNYNALSLSIEANQTTAFEFLLSKGDKWTATDNEAVNPYRVASAFGRSDIIRILEKNNISGRQGLRIDEVSFAVSTRFNVRDFFTGAAIVFKEPMINAGFVIGCDIKPVYTRILMKTGENNYYQYFDRSSLAFAGIFKDFTLTEYRPGSKFAVSPSLSAGYILGGKFKGTNITPGNKLRIIPAVTLKLQVNHLIFTSGIEYTNTDFYKIGPLWLRFGFAYNLFLSNTRSPVKSIKWY